MRVQGAVKREETVCKDCGGYLQTGERKVCERGRVA